MVDEQILLAQVDAILGEKGLIASGDKRFAYNPQQHAYARRVAAGFLRYDEAGQRASLNMLEAATGTGKTIGYLVPLFLFSAATGERVAVSTFTRYLQKQVVEDDAPVVIDWVRKITGKTLTVMRRVGIKNFASYSACAKLRDELLLSESTEFDDAVGLLNQLMTWLTKTEKKRLVNSGLLDDFFEQHQIASLPRGVTLAEISLSFGDDEADKVSYTMNSHLTKDVDVLVINHALFITNALLWTSLLDDVAKRPLSVVVCDEADKLPAVAESLSSGELSLARACHVVDAYGASINQPQLMDAFQSLYDYAAQLSDQSMQVSTDRDALTQRLIAARRTVESIKSKLVRKIEAGHEANLVELEFLDLCEGLSSFISVINDKGCTAFVSFSPVLRKPSLCIGRVNPGTVLSRLWNPFDWNVHQDKDAPSSTIKRSYLRAALFTSATITTPGRSAVEQFDDFALSIGAIRHKNVHNTTTDLYAVFEPAKFGKMAFVLADPSAPLPSLKAVEAEAQDYTSNPDWLDYCAKMIRSAGASGERVLVLTLSYVDTTSLGTRLADMDTIICHKRGEALNDVVDKFIATKGGILISPTAWEGVNLPGLIKHLVVTRIPFTPLESNQANLLALHLQSKGYSSDKIAAISQTRASALVQKKLKQGLGRPIRSKGDACTVWISDPRFPLPDAFYASLDPVVLKSTARTYPIMINCIPRRFQEAFSASDVFLLDGQRYQPIGENSL